MNNTNEKIRNEKNQNEEDVKIEKSAIVALIILTLVLVYFSLFFIHNIIDIGSASGSQNVNMNGADNNVTNNTNITNNTNGTRNNTNWVNGVPVNQAGNNATDNNEPGANTSENNVPGNTTPGNNVPENNVPSGNNTANETPIVDNSARIKIFEGSKEWHEIKELSVFQNEYYPELSMIAPGVSGKYNFTVENHRDGAIKYDISYSEINMYNINLKFKLKRNGSYIAGDANNYVSVSDLSKTGFALDSNKTDVYTIEWKWIDAPNDTEIGMTEGANYKLSINTYAEEIE